MNFAKEIEETDCSVKERPSIMRRESGLASITQTSVKQNSTQSNFYLTSIPEEVKF